MSEEKEYSHCLRCGRKLRNQKSRIIGYGSVCERKMKHEKSYRLFETDNQKEKPLK